MTRGLKILDKRRLGSKVPTNQFCCINLYAHTPPRYLRRQRKSICIEIYETAAVSEILSTLGQCGFKHESCRAILKFTSLVSPVVLAPTVT